MTRYHPDTRFLTDYAAGTLPQEHALCVASHLHYCRACRQKVSELNMLGDILFSNQPPATLSETAFDDLMARIDSGVTSPVPEVIIPPETENNADSLLPPLVARLTHGDLDSLHWQNVGKSFRYSRLTPRGSRYETGFLHIRAGGAAPRHQHQGDEITVVLQGGYSDQDGHYHEGDFVVRSTGEKHQPVASQDEDCLCIATLDAPLRLTNPVLRMLVIMMEKRASKAG